MAYPSNPLLQSHPDLPTKGRALTKRTGHLGFQQGCVQFWACNLSACMTLDIISLSL